MVFKKLKQIIRLFRQESFEYFWVALSWRLPNWLFYYNHSFLLKSDRLNLVNRNYTRYFEKYITLEDCKLLEKEGYTRELIEARLNAGDRGIIICRNDNIVTICWAASGKRFLKLSGAILNPGQDGVIFYGVYTKKSYRFMGFFPKVFSDLYKFYLAKGHSRVYLSIDKYNVSSLNIHKRMNFEIIGETVYIILFGISICFYKSWPFQTKKIHIFIKKPPHNLEWV